MMVEIRRMNEDGERERESRGTNEHGLEKAEGE